MSVNDSKSDRSPPWETRSEGESVGFGLWLRRQRELREIPLREIADVTKISLRYLEALEQDRFDVLPAPVFAKGFLRQYSRYVGLDADEVVNSFLIATGEIDDPDEVFDENQSRGRSGRGDRTRVFGALAILAIVLIVVAIAVVSRLRQQEPAHSSSLAAPVPRSTTTDMGSAADSGVAEDARSVPLTVTVDFTEDCWVEAVIDGDRSISELRVQGESMRIDAEERVLLTLGNPAGVRVEVNGAAFDFPYSPSRIVRNLEIDLALAASLSPGDVPQNEGTQAAGSEPAPGSEPTEELDSASEPSDEPEPPGDAQSDGASDVEPPAGAES